MKTLCQGCQFRGFITGFRDPNPLPSQDTGLVQKRPIKWHLSFVDEVKAVYCAAGLLEIASR
ncbi:hypothetical protein JZ751_013329 [Albula glossodonta]|uniref:Uncharacterized protein n=1 Tax=Albula glossodonta TaxID=121402 RepID=A0A8T2NXT0_9TELE|nr:hypothetical protein JZ751_013329 [Albula glossodonta]